MGLMEMLHEAGYRQEDFFHHRSDLYVYATPLTEKVIDEWCEENGFVKRLFVSKFIDQVTGRPMFDIAFQYLPYWYGDRN